MQHDNRWRLNSAAADDVRWFFRSAAAAMGMHANACQPVAETETHGQKRGTNCIAVHSSRPAASSSTTEKSDQVLIAVARERRIRTALSQLSTPTYRTLQVAYEARQYTPEIRRVFGDFADLAMRMPRCQAAYDRYAQEGGTYELETWLTRRCREKGKADTALLKMREEAERAIGDALAAYQTRRIRPGAEERGPKPKRRSPLERVREAIEKDLKR